MEYKRIDVDSHFQENPDTWTSRMSRAKWGDRIPHLEEYTTTPNGDPGAGPSYKVALNDRAHRWVINGEPRLGAPALCHAAMPDKETLPTRWEDVPLSVYDPEERLKAMDQDHVDCEVLYPNTTGPTGDSFLGMDPEFQAEAIRAYNDFLIEEVVSVNKERFVPLCVVPSSDIETVVGEVRHAVQRGHRGVIMASAPHQRGMPFFNDPYWDPLWSTAVDLDIPVNFHGSGGARRMRVDLPQGISQRRNRALTGSIGFNLQAQYMSNFLFSGIFDRFPKITFVVAESGIGWLPYVLEACDHEWEQNKLYSYGLTTKPSDVFHQHLYVDFWYEQEGLKNREFIGVDRIMWESDFPHPTSLWPNSDKYIEASFRGVPDADRQKILVENPRRLYKI